MIRRRNHAAAETDRQEQERLAAGGEPSARAALAAGATVLDSRPIAPGEPTDDESREANTGANGSQTRTGKPPKRSVAQPRVRTAKKNDRSETELPFASPLEAKTPEERTAKAYRLMDTAFKKWNRDFRKDPRKASRELAADLGQDTSLYMEAGILRLGDMLDAINKLAPQVKPEKESTANEDDFETDLEQLRKDLRGEKSSGD